MDGIRTWPKFEQGLQFYVPTGPIFVELNSYSNDTIQNEQRLFVCVLEIPTIETQIGIKSSIFDRNRSQTGRIFFFM